MRLLFKQVMTHQPFIAVTEPPKLGAGHKEYPPVCAPFRRLFVPVGFGKNRRDRGLVGVHFFQPRLGSPLVVGSANTPVTTDGEIILKVEQKIIRRHGAPFEEVARDPIRRIAALEVISEFAVGENVHEQLAARPEPSSNLGHEQLVIFHVLEHLDRNHAIEPAIPCFKNIHIHRENANIAKPSTRRLGVDMRLLRRGIRNTGDP